MQRFSLKETKIFINTSTYVKDWYLAYQCVPHDTLKNSKDSKQFIISHRGTDIDEAPVALVVVSTALCLL